MGERQYAEMEVRIACALARLGALVRARELMVGHLLDEHLAAFRIAELGYGSVRSGEVSGSYLEELFVDLATLPSKRLKKAGALATWRSWVGRSREWKSVVDAGQRLGFDGAEVCKMATSIAREAIQEDRTEVAGEILAGLLTHWAANIDAENCDAVVELLAMVHRLGDAQRLVSTLNGLGADELLWNSAAASNWLAVREVIAAPWHVAATPFVACFAFCVLDHERAGPTVRMLGRGVGIDELLAQDSPFLDGRRWVLRRFERDWSYRCGFEPIHGTE